MEYKKYYCWMLWYESIMEGIWGNYTTAQAKSTILQLE